MTTTTGASEVWQARIGHELAAALRADSEVLGLSGRTEIVKAGLELIHRRAAEQRMASSVEGFYQGRTPDLPIGVLAGDEEPAERSDAGETARRRDGAA